ncbi:hypothetical protein B0H13DRAFT_1156234 [Mycena leptocephala]|nr:hypothetical protein B0H13DRAFT_1156234 [Mycena leptocephala]
MFSDSDIPSTSSVSYVYPVRSLLSNSIQRASNATPPVSRRQSGAAETRANGGPTDGAGKLLSPRRRRTVSDSSATPPTSGAASPSKKSRKRRHRSSIVPPNFRHFPGEDSDPNLRRTFTATTLIKSDLTPDTLAVFSTSTSVADVASPAPELKPSQEPLQELRARPKQFPVSDDPLPPEEVPDAPLPWNPSQFDFVHLTPLPSTPPHSNKGTRSVVSTSQRSSTVRDPSNSSTSQSGLFSPRATSASGGTQRSESSQSSLSNGISGSGSESASGSDASDAFRLLTVRFQHVQDEHGNHVILGREGKLARCEDEPIRTPGAVQGFGVLIAVHEVEDALVVRQVSENAEEILGLSPRYLFSLQCFTDTLPESQAGALWEFLSESDLNTQEEKASPYVFLLTGWGAPGSAAPDDPEASAGRRKWTCWCAVHRPLDPASGASLGLIIMEFELERDTLNPLYPLTDEAGAHFTPLGSVSSGSGSSAPRTENGGEVIDGRFGSDTSQRGRNANPNAMGRKDGSSTGVCSRVDSEKVNMGPSAEIFWKARPHVQSHCLRWSVAAHRARRSYLRHRVPALPSETRSRRSRRAGGSAAGGVGMMDVFAVMAEINEQLGDAPDLAAFLQVSSG